MEEPQIRACPFCGETMVAKQSISANFGFYRYMNCNNCAAHGPITDDRNHVELWNTRPVEDALTKKNEELRKTVSDLLTIIGDHGDKTIMAHATKIAGARLTIEVG
jgi:Lar family restriction alleviation protein